MNTFIAPDLHPDAELAIDANETLSFLGEMDPLPDLPITVVAAELHGVSIHAWLATRAMWYEEGIRGDIKQAVQSAELVNLAYAQGDEPHPLVEMLATSDPIDTTSLKDHFAPARLAREASWPVIMRRALLWALGITGTMALIAVGIAADILTGI